MTTELREQMALAIARTMGGWNDDTSEPDQTEPMRSALEAHWEKVNQTCLTMGREMADAVLKDFHVIPMASDPHPDIASGASYWRGRTRDAERQLDHVLAALGIRMDQDPIIEARKIKARADRAPELLSRYDPD